MIELIVVSCLVGNTLPCVSINLPIMNQSHECVLTGHSIKKLTNVTNFPVKIKDWRCVVHSTIG